jgi:hypothetical protein
MRCALVIGFALLMLPASLQAQVESPQARELRAQLESIQLRLDQLRRQEAGGRNVAEIGSSRGRARQEEEPQLTVRIYDLGDLYSIAPGYAAQEPADLQAMGRDIFARRETAARAADGPSAVGGMGGGMFSIPSTVKRSNPHSDTLHQAGGAMGGTVSDSARTSVDSLVDTITATISPDQWDDVGGPASITTLGASLIVSAPLDTHDKIGALLDLFRKRWRSLRTISVEAHWLWLTESELSSAPLKAEDAAAFGVLSDSAWKKLRELASADAQRRTGYHAVLTCYNGQTVHALAGEQRVIVAGMTPVVGGGESSAAYQPQIRVVQEGAALQLTPIATRTAKYVVADVHSRVNLLGRPAEKREAPDEEGASASDPTHVVAALDRPVLQSQRLSTTLRIPVGRPMLIGGMTFSAGRAEPNLYLFLTPHVQELRDEEPDEAEAALGKPAPREDKRPEANDPGKAQKP